MSKTNAAAFMQRVVDTAAGRGTVRAIAGEDAAGELSFVVELHADRTTRTYKASELTLVSVT